MIRAKGCSVRYGKHIDALTDIDFEATAGTMTGVIGPNGAGKTTLIKCLAGLIAPTSGTVAVDGRILNGMPPRARAALIAYVPQAGELPFAYRALEIVLMGRAARLKPFAFEGQSDIEASLAALAAVDAGEFAGRYFHELSGGEQQRVVLARALAQETPMLLLDEPTTSLDLCHTVAFYRLLKRRCAERNATVVAAMHDLNMAAFFCDRLVVLDRGRVASVGSAREVLTEETVERVFGVEVDTIEMPPGTMHLFPRP